MVAALRTTFFVSVIAAVLILAAAPVRAAGQLFFPWDTPPTASTSFYRRYATPPGCEEGCQPVQVQGILTGFSGVHFGFDADGDGDRDGTLTADIQIVSEVIPTVDGQFQYAYTLKNLGTGPVIAVVGTGPLFTITRTNPLPGTSNPAVPVTIPQRVTEPVTEGLDQLLESVASAFASSHFKSRAANRSISLASRRNPSAIADRIASDLPIEVSQKQELVELLNPAKRLEKLLGYLSGPLGP